MLLKLIYIQIFLLTFGTVFSQHNCDKYPDNYIPKNLNDALEYLNCKWSKKDINDFLIKNEKDAVDELHMGAGQAIRNSWDLWGKKRNSIVRYFNSLGIYHADDMSSIILISFHRKLNNKDIDLQQQVDVCLKYWKSIKVEQKNIKKTFKAYSIGDTIKVPLGVLKSGGVVSFNVWSNQTNEKKFDCIVHGIIVDKTTRKKSYTLKLRLIDLCNIDEATFGDEKIKIGNVIDLNMKYSKILD